MAKLMWVEWGSGWDQVVSVLAFNSDSPSSNHADAYSFSVKFAFEKTKNKQKSGSGCPFLKKTCIGRKLGTFSAKVVVPRLVAPSTMPTEKEQIIFPEYFGICCQSVTMKPLKIKAEICKRDLNPFVRR